MATKKDLVEAHAFSRRRLVTAFVSGAPGGREVEPVKPGRVLVGGIALSVLLLAGAAIAGFLLGRPPAAWLEEGSFVISKDTGEQYVVLVGGDDPMLQRVPNYISAQLLLGQSELSPNTVRDKYIAEVRLGPDLGIEGAPASLPDPELLLDDGWTACTGDREGVKLAMATDQDVNPLAGSAFMVTHEGRYWLIASSTKQDGSDDRAYKFEVPADRADQLANLLGFAAVAQAPEVDADWINLFHDGPPLVADEFAMPSAGQKIPYASESDLSKFRIGDLVRTPGGYYLMAEDSPMEVSEFGARVYEATVGPAKKAAGDLLDTRAASTLPEEWPSGAELPTPVQTGAMCAVLHPSASGETRVSLADSPTGQAGSEDVRAGTHSVYVQPSRGAYVLSGAEGAEDGTPYVIDSKAVAYKLVGGSVPEYIGYGGVTAPVVPNTWMKFFEEGAELSTNRAKRVEDDAGDEAEAGSGSGSQ